MPRQGDYIVPFQELFIKDHPKNGFKMFLGVGLCGIMCNNMQNIRVVRTGGREGGDASRKQMKKYFSQSVLAYLLVKKNNITVFSLAV